MDEHERTAIHRLYALYGKDALTIAALRDSQQRILGDRGLVTAHDREQTHITDNAKPDDAASS